MINDDIGFLNKNLEIAKYTFAKTMATTPHHYTLRIDWDDADFVKTVELIRKHGKKQKFFSKEYIYYYLNGYKYWTMGCPLHNCNKTGTILVNKAKVEYDTFYNNIAEDYIAFFKKEDYLEEDLKLFETLNLDSEKDVLDVGCGGAMFLNYNNPKSYTGIDVASTFIERNKLNYPEKDCSFYNTSFEDFYTEKKFDYIVSLYGSASYINEDILIKKSKNMLKDSGKIILMFYDAKYTPDTYKQFGIFNKNINKKEDGELMFNKYRVLFYDKNV
jgi:hypothetical protein